ncbi:MAG: SDR family oxidoreductase [Spirochaetes bacterium]|nr:SDR family oxidoreductase [Spirochaetota bacterium]
MSFIESMFSLEGKTVVITGGGGGIPGNLAAAFAKAGAVVVLWGRGTNHPMDEAAAQVAEAAGGGRIFAVTVDTGSREACEAAIAESERLTGGFLEILVNGGGGNRGRGPFIDVDELLFKGILELNLLAGLVTPTRAFAKYWIAKGIKGNVINMTSMTSYKALSGTWAYDAAKAGVLNLNEALAKELAPYGIRVNAIAPGFFVGNQNRALLIDEKTGDLTTRGKAIIGRTPFGRFGKFEELWGAALFLASDAASGFVTGVSIPVDGGYLTDNI